MFIVFFNFEISGRKMERLKTEKQIYESVDIFKVPDERLVMTEDRLAGNASYWRGMLPYFRKYQCELKVESFLNRS